MTADEKVGLLTKMSFTTKLEDFHSTDFIVEAIVENFEVKKNLFQTLDKITPKETILASNTSSISLTKIAGTIPHRADKVIGMHFMNPVPVMKLIEVISGLQTSDDTLQTTLDLAQRMGKTCT